MQTKLNASGRVPVGYTRHDDGPSHFGWDMAEYVFDLQESERQFGATVVHHQFGRMERVA